MPSSTLLPTPEPEKMPIRCPRPQVKQAVDRANAGGQRLVDAGARAGVGRAAIARRAAAQRRLRPAVDRRCLRRRSPGPAVPGPTRSQCVVRTSRTRLPRCTPLRSLKGHNTVRSSRNPTTSANSGAPDGRWISATAPTGAGNPAAETVVPTVCATLPVKAVGMMWSSCSMRSVVPSSTELL